jgi:hypothetical protein
MKTLQIDERKAKELYASASPEFQAALVDTFGEEFFKEITFEQITTWGMVCQVTGEDSLADKFHTGTEDEKAYQRLKVIVKALNPKGWVADWNNSSQPKWGNWFWMNNPGFRFYGTYFDYAAAYATGGSRLCFSEKKRAEHAAKYFLDVYKSWLS